MSHSRSSANGPALAVALGIAIMTFFVGGGIGSAVIDGLGGLVGIAACLAYLAAYPLLAATLVRPFARYPAATAT